MATADSVKAKIQGLIASANAKTGNTDADLTTAVNALITGFGQGGGGSSGGAEWKKVVSYTPTSATYLTTMLFDNLELTASYSSGIIISYGNSDTATQSGNFMGVFVYTPTEIQCFVQGANNGSIGQYGGLKYTRSGQGAGGLFGAQNVGSVRSGYVIVGATYNVYECSLPDEFAEKIMWFSTEG